MEYDFMTKVGKKIKINNRLSLQRYKYNDTGKEVVEFIHSHVEETMFIKAETLQAVYKKLEQVLNSETTV
jgi:hypothetical protein